MALLVFLLLGSALAQNSCYYAAGKRAGSAIVPCSSGTSACCQIGDLCLADSACWNPVYNVTYLYGCTDSTYEDVSCPWKCGSSFDSAPYVGLDYCYNTTRNEWSCTHPPSNSDAIQPFPAQQCVDDSIIAFAGPSSLQPILSLPTNVGGSTAFFSQVNPTSYIIVAGYTPTRTNTVTASVPTSVELVSSTAASSTSASSTGASTTRSRTSSGMTSTSATNAASSTSSSSGLSTGAKAGIGAGLGGAALAIAAVVIAFMILRRKKKSAAGSQTSSLEKPDFAYSALGQREKPIQSAPAELPPTERLGTPSRPSELPPDERLSWGTPAPTYSSWSSPPQKPAQIHELP